MRPASCLSPPLVAELTSLARAAVRGDRDALAMLVRQTQGDAWRFCALGKFRGDAEVRTWRLLRGGRGRLWLSGRYDPLAGGPRPRQS